MRFRRRLLFGLAAVSLGVAAGLAGVWVRSYWRADSVSYRFAPVVTAVDVTMRYGTAGASHGGCYLQWTTGRNLVAYRGMSVAMPANYPSGFEWQSSSDAHYPRYFGPMRLRPGDKGTVRVPVDFDFAGMSACSYSMTAPGMSEMSATTVIVPPWLPVVLMTGLGALLWRRGVRVPSRGFEVENVGEGGSSGSDAAVADGAR